LRILLACSRARLRVGAAVSHISTAPRANPTPIPMNTNTYSGHVMIRSRGQRLKLASPRLLTAKTTTMIATGTVISQRKRFTDIPYGRL
jgi:hypothetical protein